MNIMRTYTSNIIYYIQRIIIKIVYCDWDERNLILRNLIIIAQSKCIQYFLWRKREKNIERKKYLSNQDLKICFIYIYIYSFLIIRVFRFRYSYAYKLHTIKILHKNKTNI